MKKKNIRILEDIINSQRSPFIKTSLDFEENQKITKEDSSSKATELPKKNEENPKGYIDGLKKSINSSTKKEVISHKRTTSLTKTTMNHSHQGSLIDPRSNTPLVIASFAISLVIRLWIVEFIQGMILVS